VSTVAALPEAFPVVLDPRVIHEVDAVLATTRSIRHRLDLDRPVDPADIEACLDIAVQAPTGGNRQGWHFIVVTDPIVRKGLGEIYRRSFAAYAAEEEGRQRAVPVKSVMGAAAALAADIDRAPVLLVACIEGRWEGLTSGQAQAGLWGSVLPAVWSFMIAARARGLGTTWTTMHLRHEEEAAELLGIPFDRVSQVCLTPVAHIIGETLRPGPRHDMSSNIHRDSWTDLA
jgi:nitroreductase